MSLPDMSETIETVRSLCSAIVAERARQKQLHPGTDVLPNGTGDRTFVDMAKLAKYRCDKAHVDGLLTHAHVFDEECCEVLAATNDYDIEKELIQVMAVAAKWCEDIRRRRRTGR